MNISNTEEIIIILAHGPFISHRSATGAPRGGGGVPRYFEDIDLNQYRVRFSLQIFIEERIPDLNPLPYLILFRF